MGLEKITEYKRKLGLTTQQLSELSGVPVGTLNKLLNGATKDPKLDTLKALAKVYNCSISEFNDDENAELTRQSTFEDMENYILRHGYLLTDEQKLELIRLLVR